MSDEPKEWWKWITNGYQIYLGDQMDTPLHPGAMRIQLLAHFRKHADYLV